MTILITGGTGLIGKQLTNLLLAKGHTIHILTRSAKPSKKKIYYFEWDIDNQTIDNKCFEGVDMIIHLAGSPVAVRWTEKNKKEIYNSRVISTELLYKAVKENNYHIKKIISASGINYYGTVTQVMPFKETDNQGHDFLANVCGEWEKYVLKFKELGTSIAILRTGVVLSKTGGALVKMKPVFEYNLGSGLGTGKQIFSWIHIDDLVNLYDYLINHPDIVGVYNAVSSEVIDNQDFLKELANALHKIFLPVNVPAVVLKAILGKMSSILLNGSPIDNHKIKETGFNFRFENSREALENLLDSFS